MDINFTTICKYCGNFLTDGFISRRDKNDHSVYEVKTHSCYCQTKELGKQLEAEREKVKELENEILGFKYFKEAKNFYPEYGKSYLIRHCNWTKMVSYEGYGFFRDYQTNKLIVGKIDGYAYFPRLKETQPKGVINARIKC